jgi:hypothetical protein
LKYFHLAVDASDSGDQTVQETDRADRVKYEGYQRAG